MPYYKVCHARQSRIVVQVYFLTFRKLKDREAPASAANCSRHEDKVHPKSAPRGKWRQRNAAQSVGKRPPCHGVAAGWA